jgi:hypothetical protein
MARAGPKAKKKSKRLTPVEQHARFVTAAKEAEADESPNAMDNAFRQMNLKNLERKK